MKKFLKALGHAALGGAMAGMAPVITNSIPMIPHIDPGTAMILGSVASSLFSAFSKPPHVEE